LGLENVRRRVSARYGAGARFEASAVDGVYRVVVRVSC
jgi:hypothetical protein